MNNLVSVGACLGLDEVNIDFETEERPLHRDVVSVVQQLKNAAHQQGFDLALASGYRSFDRQLTIWNAMARGEKPVLDSNEEPIAREYMSNTEIMFAILRWSALPGASRHHWGTDFDIYDRSAMPEGYDLQLSVAETVAGGVFEKMYRWLTEFLQSERLPLKRPYAVDLGGVAPEPWHISVEPVASVFEQALQLQNIATQIRQTDIEFKNEILQNLDEIYHRFVFPEVKI